MWATGSLQDSEIIALSIPALHLCTQGPNSVPVLCTHLTTQVAEPLPRTHSHQQGEVIWCSSFASEEDTMT